MTSNEARVKKRLSFLVGTAFVTAVATSASSFDVIIGDRALGFLNAGLQFSDAVTDGKAESLLNALRPTICMEESILRRRIISHVFLQEVRGAEGQVEAIFQPRFLDAHAITAITDAVSIAQ